MKLKLLDTDTGRYIEVQGMDPASLQFETAAGTFQVREHEGGLEVSAAEGMIAVLPHAGNVIRVKACK